MTTTLTKPERKYIKAMFSPDYPKLASITNISQMNLGALGLFIENRDLALEASLPRCCDHTITEKYLAFHKLPLDMTYAKWDKWVSKQPKHLR